MRGSDVYVPSIADARSEVKPMVEAKTVEVVPAHAVLREAEIDDKPRVSVMIDPIGVDV